MQSYGGILYNLWTLSAAIGHRATIVPVVRVGKDHDADIRKALSTLKGVSSEAVLTVNRLNNHCILKYSSISRKTETLQGWVGGVSREHLDSAMDSDFILVNYISGSDISTNNFRRLRIKSDACIYLDFHSRTLGRRPDGTRYLRRPRDWRSTIACADIVQMNDVEFELLTGTRPVLENCRRLFTKPAFQSLKTLLVTLGKDGCLVVNKSRNGVVSVHIPAPKVASPKDTTGCGDIFGAAFLAHYIQNRDVFRSAEFAVSVASRRVGLDGSNWVRSIKAI